MLLLVVYLSSEARKDWRERKSRMSQARVGNEWKPRGRKERPDFALTCPNDLDFLSPDEAVLQSVLTSCYILSSLRFSLSPISLSLLFLPVFLSDGIEGRATGKKRQFFPSRTWATGKDTFVKQLPAFCLPTVGFLSYSNFSFISLIFTDFRPLFLLEISCRNFLSLKNLLRCFSSYSHRSSIIVKKIISLVHRLLSVTADQSQSIIMRRFPSSISIILNECIQSA